MYFYNKNTKFMKKILLSILCLTSIISATAQINYYEGFNNVGGPTSGGPGTYPFATGMLLRNVDNLTPDAAVSYINEAWERREDFSTTAGGSVADSAAFSTSWYTPAGTSNDFMWTKPVVVPANGRLFWYGVAYDPLYPDGYEVRIMTTTPTGGTGVIGNQLTSSTVLYSTTAEASTWTSHTVSLAAYATQTVYIGFRNTSTDKFVLLIDDITIYGCNYPVTTTSLSCGGLINDGTASVTDVMLPVSASSFTWLPTGGNSVTATGLAAGTYSCVITNFLGCAVTVTTNVTVKATPTISVNSGSICAGSSFTLNPTGAVTYSYSSGSPIVNPTSTSSFVVTGTGSNGCVSTVGAISTVTVNPIVTPSVNISTSTPTICGSSAVFTSTIANGGSTPAYQWKKNGVNVGSGLPTYSPTSLLNGDLIHCILTSNAQCLSTSTANSNTVTITVSPTPTINIVSSNPIICPGISVGLTASGASTYTWSTGGTTPIIPVSPTVTTTYTVYGVSSFGCSSMATITQSVNTCTSLLASTIENGLYNLYPNPSFGIFNVELAINSKVEITNAIGQIVYSKVMSTGNNNIDIQNQAKGIYFVKITTSDKQHVVKIIKE